MMKSLSCLVLLSLFIANAAFASEASIRSGMQKRFPYQKLISVTKTPYSGLYEVVFEDQLVYTDEKLNYLFSGNVIDMRTMQNLTEAREKELYAVNLDTLPLSQAIKSVRGNGQRKLVIFSDPNCSYCKSLEKEIANLTNVTVYIFPIPILNGSEEKIRAVWCSPDRLKAWEDMMQKGVAPAPEKKCDTAVLTEFSQLAKKRRISTTPTLIFEDGFMKPGWMPLDLLEKQLAASSTR
ncbi:putative thiol:disulfide interchange protein DsbC [Gallionellaceae bacterium]|nr:putative thiol:disulfide interchange protein DsbC [Gallionellaceae bacterium]